MKTFFFIALLFLFVAFHILPARAEGEVEGAQSMPASGTGIAAPVHSRAAPPPQDLPLEQEITGAVTPRFVIEHRSALDGKVITVHGVVTMSLTGEAACPPERGMCAQPRVVLSDGEAGVAPDSTYDLVVLLPEGDATAYTRGQEAELQGRVSASPHAAVLRKE
ncbi:MAG: hypothetical protein ACAH80_04580 [Alphaproteobacteria bacterium]